MIFIFNLIQNKKVKAQGTPSWGTPFRRHSKKQCSHVSVGTLFHCHFKFVDRMVVVQVSTPDLEAAVAEPMTATEICKTSKE